MTRFRPALPRLRAQTRIPSLGMWGWARLAIVTLALGAGRTTAAQTVSSTNPGALTLQGGQSAMFTVFGSGLLGFGALQVTTVGNGAPMPGASATFASSGDTQRRVTLATTASLAGGQATVRAQQKNGSWVTLPVTITTVAAPNDAAITIAGLQITPTAAYTTETRSAAVTLSAPPLAPLAFELFRIPPNGFGSVIATGIVAAGSSTGSVTFSGQPAGDLVLQARRPPYTTGPVDTAKVHNPPPISTLAFTGPLLAGVPATLLVTLQFPPALGGVLAVTSSTNTLYPGNPTSQSSYQVPPSQVPGPSTFSVPIQVSNVTASVSGTLTATFLGSVKTLPFTIQPAMAAPPITSFTPATATTTGGLPVSLTVGLGAAVSGSAATLKVTSANPGVVPAPADVVVPVGATSVTIQVATLPVGTTSAVPLTFMLGASTATTTVTVNPPHPVALSFSPPLNAGQPVTGKVSLNGIVGGPPGVAVSLTSANAALAVPPATVTVLPGAFEASFTVQTQGTFAAQSTSVGITGTTALGSATGALVLQRTTGVLSGLSVSPSSVDGGTSATGTVTFDMPAKAGGSGVSLTSSSASAIVPSSVTVPAGATSQTFSLSSAPVTGNTLAVLTANDGLVTKTTTVAVTPPLVLASLSSPSSIVDGGQSFVVTATFNGPVPAGTSVSLTSSHPSALVPAVVVPSTGATSVAATITTTTVLQDQVVTLTATWQGVSVSKAITVRAPATVQSLTMTPGATWTGGSATALIALNRAVLSPTVVALSTSNPAVATVPATVTIQPNQQSASATVTPAPGPGATVSVVAALNGTSASDTLAVAPYLTTLTLSIPGLPGKDTLSAGTAYQATIVLAARVQTSLPITLSHNGGALLSMPGSVTVAPNGTSVPLTITTGTPSVTTNLTITVSGGGYTLTRQYVLKP